MYGWLAQRNKGTNVYVNKQKLLQNVQEHWSQQNPSAVDGGVCKI